MPVKSELIKTSLRATVTESAANTYTEATLDTNLSIRGDHIFIVTGIWWQHTAVLVGDADSITVQLAYSPQTNVISPGDGDYFASYSIVTKITTSGQIVYKGTEYMPINDFPIAVGALYLGVKGVSLASAVVAGVKLEGYHVKVNSTEYFRMAQSR